MVAKSFYNGTYYLFNYYGFVSAYTNYFVKRGEYFFFRSGRIAKVCYKAAFINFARSFVLVTLNLFF